MKCGRLPFPQYETWKFKRENLTHNIPDPSEIIPELPQPLCKFIMKCGKSNPEIRYRDVREAMQDLRAAVKNTDLRYPTLPRLKTTNLMLTYSEDHQQELSRLIDEFMARVKKTGVELKIGYFEDI
jgi:hypothetical protein